MTNLSEKGLFQTSENHYNYQRQKRVILRKGYPFPMLAMELLTKEWKREDSLNELHFSLKCYVVKWHFRGEGYKHLAPLVLCP